MRESNVVAIDGGKVALPNPKPVESVVDALQKALERAQSGDIDGLAFIVHHRDEMTSGGVFGSVSYSMVGRIEETKQTMLEELNKQ